MKNIRIFDLNNGDLFVFFGKTYAHTYNKEENLKQLKEDIKVFKNGEVGINNWDNNEINLSNSLQEFENDETVEEIEEKDIESMITEQE